MKKGQEPAFPITQWCAGKKNSGMSKRFFVAFGFAKTFAKSYFDKNSKIKTEINNPKGIIWRKKMTIKKIAEQMATDQANYVLQIKAMRDLAYELFQPTAGEDNTNSAKEDKENQNEEQ